MNKISRTLTVTKVTTTAQTTITDKPETLVHEYVGKYTAEQAQKKIKKISKDMLYEVVTKVEYTEHLYTMPIETFIQYATES